MGLGKQRSRVEGLAVGIYQNAHGQRETAQGRDACHNPKLRFRYAMAVLIAGFSGSVCCL